MKEYWIDYSACVKVKAKNEKEAKAIFSHNYRDTPNEFFEIDSIEEITKDE